MVGGRADTQLGSVRHHDRHSMRHASGIHACHGSAPPHLSKHFRMRFSETCHSGWRCLSTPSTRRNPSAGSLRRISCARRSTDHHAFRRQRQPAGSQHRQRPKIGMRASQSAPAPPRPAPLPQEGRWPRAPSAFVRGADFVVRSLPQGVNVSSTFNLAKAIGDEAQLRRDTDRGRRCRPPRSGSARSTVGKARSRATATGLGQVILLLLTPIVCEFERRDLDLDSPWRVHRHS